MTDPLREAAQAVVEAIDGILNAESPYSLTYGDFVPLQRAHDALRAALAAPAPAPARYEHDAEYRWIVESDEDGASQIVAKEVLPSFGAWVEGVAFDQRWAAPAPAPSAFGAAGRKTEEQPTRNIGFAAPAPAPELDRERLARALMRYTGPGWLPGTFTVDFAGPSQQAAARRVADALAAEYGRAPQGGKEPTP